MTGAEIESFIRAFEDGSLPKSEWNAFRHLVMALWYIRRHGRDEATVLIRNGIRRYNQRHDNPNGYHETITSGLGCGDRTISGGEGLRLRCYRVLAADLLNECGEKDYLLRFYSRERLFSDEARHGWVVPDLDGDHLETITT